MAEKHSIVCVGFGLAGLSLAVALLDSKPAPDVLFLEQQPKKTWRPIDDKPAESDTTANFMNDLVTLENPRSQYTFIKFLHEKKWLVNFTNVGKTHTSQRLRGEYLKWVAEKLEPHVRYGMQVSTVEPRRTEIGGTICGWNIVTHDTIRGNSTRFVCDQVVVAVGRQPKIPPTLLPAFTQGFVVHASQSQAQLSERAAYLGRIVNVAIIGQGQQAAEIFDHLYQPYGQFHATWYTQIIDGSEKVRKSYGANPALALELQSRFSLDELLSTNVLGEVDRKLLDSIIEHQYAQSITSPDSNEWKWRIDVNRKINTVETSPTGRLRLLFNDDLLTHAHSEDFDIVIVSTGFERTTCKQLLKPIQDIYDGAELSVDGKYRVNIRRGAAQDGIGIWSIGSLEVDRSAGEDALPILAARSKRVADALTEAQRISKSSINFVPKRILAQI